MDTYRNYAKKIIRRHLQSFIKQKNCVRLARNIEYIHRMRVAARRLRTAFEIFSDVFPESDLTKWNKGIKKAAKALGKARDLDIQIVFLKELKSRLRNPKYKSIIDKFLAIRRSMRRNYQAEVINAINQLEHRQTCEIIAEALRKPCSCRENNSCDALIQRAQQSMTDQLKNVLQYEIYVEQPGHAEELHRMRIAIKRLRYTMETFKAVYGTKIDRFIKAAVTVQRLLGELHDLDIWINSLPAKESKTVSVFDINYLRRRYQGLRLQTYKRFVRYWIKLKMERCWERLNEAIASL